MQRAKAVKNYLKQFYALQRKKDSLLGRKINDTTQKLHAAMKKPDTDSSALLAELGSLREQPRFRAEFPSFLAFRKYLLDPKNGFDLQDLKDLANDI